MKLIREDTHETTVIVEGKDTDTPTIYIEGVFMQSDVKNRNRRMYPRQVLESQLESYTKAFIKENRALGELGHPETPTINLERVSHNIVEMKYVSQTDVKGRAKLLDTPYGKIAKSLVQEGVKLGMSTRGLGSLKESGGVSVVQNNFVLSAVDIVSDPSAPTAFVNGIMENKEWVLIDGVLTEMDVEQIQKDVDAAVRAKRVNLEEELLRIFQEILK